MSKPIVEEMVAVSANEYGDVFHELRDDGGLRCNLDRKENYEFDRKPLSEVDADKTRCEHCSGDAQYSGGQGSTLAAKLAAADPDEVPAP